jgi:asparagine synthase (glutamine-hydrolysing)
MMTTEAFGTSARSPVQAKGDFLVLFGGLPLPRRHRTHNNEWESLRETSNLHLACDKVTGGWSGFPFKCRASQGWLECILGELYEKTAGDGPDDILCRRLIGSLKNARDLNGHCAIVAIDTRTDTVHVWTNRFGTVHLYFCQGSQGSALGTFFPMVAEASSARKLDWEALTGYFGFGFFPGDRTFYSGVRILRPATHYEINSRGEIVKCERYWEWHHDVERNKSFDDTVDQFGELFAAVMKELLISDRIALPLSGGLDSRSTLAVINDAAGTVHDVGSIWAYSYGYSPDSIETAIGRELAGLRSLPFDAYTVRPYLFDRISEVMSAVEGFQDITQSRQASVTPFLRAHADRVIAAHWGDVWLDDVGIELPKGGTVPKGQLATNAMVKLMKRGSNWVLENLCQPRLGSVPWREVLRTFVNEELDRVQNIEDPDFRVKALKTENWSFRWTLASLRMFQSAVYPRLPFYDTRICDFMCTVPTVYVSGRRLQIEYLRRFAPDLASITWQARDANLFHSDWPWIAHLPKRAIRKATRILLGRKIHERNWEVQFAGATGNLGLAQWLSRNGLGIHEFVDLTKLDAHRKLLQVERRNPGLGYSVSMLTTFSAWLEHYG